MQGWGKSLSRGKPDIHENYTKPVVLNTFLGPAQILLGEQMVPWFRTLWALFLRCFSVCVSPVFHGGGVAQRLEIVKVRTHISNPMTGPPSRQPPREQPMNAPPLTAYRLKRLVLP